MYEYDIESTNESVIEVKNAKVCLETISSDIRNAASLASSIQVSGLEF